MSGLILPGGKSAGSPPPDDAGKKAEGGSGLVLPSSAARKKTTEPSAPAVPPTGAPAAAGQPPAQGAPNGGRRLSAEDLLFPPQGAQVQCPQCGTPYVVPVFSIIDLGANPELKQPLLGGQINTAVCQSCGAGGMIQRAPDGARAGEEMARRSHSRRGTHERSAAAEGHRRNDTGAHAQAAAGGSQGLSAPAQAVSGSGSVFPSSCGNSKASPPR